MTNQQTTNQPTTKPGNANGEATKRRIVRCSWRDGVPCTVRNSGDHYVMTPKATSVYDENLLAFNYGLDKGEMKRLLKAVGNAVREGHEVNLFGYLRFYPSVSKCETPIIMAETLGGLRSYITPLGLQPVMDGEVVSAEAVKSLNAKAKAKKAKAKVKCPKCGYEFEVKS